MQRVQESLLAKKRDGVRITRGGWGVFRHSSGIWMCNGYACALGALLLHEQPTLPCFNELGAAADLLAVPVPWILSFREGFHSWESCLVAGATPYRLGAWFASEFADDLEIT